MQKVFLLLAVALFAATVFQPRPAAAEAMLAIGIGPGGFYKGDWVYGWDNGATPETVAMNLCRGIDKENNAIPPNASGAQHNCRIV